MQRWTNLEINRLMLDNDLCNEICFQITEAPFFCLFSVTYSHGGGAGVSLDRDAARTIKFRIFITAQSFVNNGNAHSMAARSIASIV